MLPCMHAGIMNVYELIQITLLVAFHSFGLFWSIVFPFHYRRFKLEKKIKYVHITTLVLFLVLPLFPALLHLIDGYSIGIDTFNPCNGRNRAVTYTTTALPISIMLAITSSLMIIIFWTIFKVISIRTPGDNNIIIIIVSISLLYVISTCRVYYIYYTLTILTYYVYICMTKFQKVLIGSN